MQKVKTGKKVATPLTPIKRLVAPLKVIDRLVWLDIVEILQESGVRLTGQLAELSLEQLGAKAPKILPFLRFIPEVLRHNNPTLRPAMVLKGSTRKKMEKELTRLETLKQKRNARAYGEELARQILDQAEEDRPDISFAGLTSRGRDTGNHCRRASSHPPSDRRND